MKSQEQIFIEASKAIGESRAKLVAIESWAKMGDHKTIAQELKQAQGLLLIAMDALYDGFPSWKKAIGA